MNICQKCGVQTSIEDALEQCWMPSCPFRMGQAREEFYEVMELEDDSDG